MECDNCDKQIKNEEAIQLVLPAPKCEKCKSDTLDLHLCSKECVQAELNKH